MKFLPDEEQFESLAKRAEERAEESPPAPSRVKSRVYSSLVREQQKTGPLLGLGESKAAGRKLCVFEELVRIAPVGGSTKSFNCCSVCHARVWAEHFENAKIHWGGCPYVAFQNR